VRLTESLFDKFNKSKTEGYGGRYEGSPEQSSGDRFIESSRRIALVRSPEPPFPPWGIRDKRPPRCTRVKKRALLAENWNALEQ
jgi:hypothetical protein